MGVFALGIIGTAVKFLTDLEPYKPFTVVPILKVNSDEGPCGHFTAWGAAPVGKDRFIVVDQEDERLMLFDHDGNFIKSWGKNGSGPGKFNEATGMTWDDKGNAYVVDSWGAAIDGYDSEGKPVMALSFDGKGFYGPRGVAYDGGNFALADTGKNRIWIVSPDGMVVESWGYLRGSGDDEWDSPLDIIADGKGNFFAADTGNNRVKKLDGSGKILKMIKMGKSSPQALALDKEGRLYVAFKSPETSGIKVFGPDGDYLGDLRDGQNSADPFHDIHRLVVLPGDRLLATYWHAFAMFQIPTS